MPVCQSVRFLAWNNSTPTKKIFVKFRTCVFPKSFEKIQFCLKYDKNDWYFTWQNIAEFFLELKLFQTSLCTSSRHAFYVVNFSSENRAVSRIIWKHKVQPHRPQTTLCNRNDVHFLPDNQGKNTDTHSEYLIPIASWVISAVWCRKMFYGIPYKNWEIAQWLFCHYDLFTEIIRLKKAMRKRTLFYILFSWFRAS